MRKICTFGFVAFACAAQAEDKSLIIDVPALAHASQAHVEQVLGQAEFCRKAKYGLSCRFAAHGIEIVFANDQAERMTINELGDIPYDPAAITHFGLKTQEPDVSSEELIRWDRIPGIAEVTLFPNKDKIDYALITLTPAGTKK